MLRVSFHAGLPSQASRYNRLGWLDIGYAKLSPIANYKVFLFEAGIGGREPVYLDNYPRWSASLWDLVARAMALAYWRAGPALDLPVTEPPQAVGSDGEPIVIDDVTPSPKPRPAIHCNAAAVEVPPAEDIGERCAFASRLCALITHQASSGVGGRRLGTLIVAHDKCCRGRYVASIEEDLIPRRNVTPFVFGPRKLRPAELVLRATLHALSEDVNSLPALPPLVIPKPQKIGSIHYVPLHRLEEPARTGFTRWLHQKGMRPKPEEGASLGRVREELFYEFLAQAV
jgi:hypothetical protein